MEYNGENDLLAHYDHSGLRTDDVQGVNITSAGVDAGLASSAGNYRYLKDALGSVTEIVDANANLIQQYEYSAYGKILKISDGTGADISSHPVVKTSYTFTGREHDDESGLYYYRARYYDPGTGRFLQEDPHPGRMSNPVTVVNSYVYCGNNPLAFRDSSGRWFGLDDLIVGVVGGILNLVSIGSNSTNNNLGIGQWIGVFFSGVIGSVVGYNASLAVGSLGVGLGSLVTSSLTQLTINGLSGLTGPDSRSFWAVAGVGAAFSTLTAGVFQNTGFSDDLSRQLGKVLGVSIGETGSGVISTSAGTLVDQIYTGVNTSMMRLQDALQGIKNQQPNPVPNQ